MALTHALATNNYGPAKLIVATSAANGTHTTLAGAMADAVSGDTIFLRDSVTENVTLTAGVNIAAWTGGTLNTPTITGTLTMTTAGTCNISGIRLASNGAEFLSVTGSAASIVNLINCYCTTAFDPGITFSSSSGSSEINFKHCYGDISASAKKFFAHSSSGVLRFTYSFIANSGASTTASTASAGILDVEFCDFAFPITYSSSSVFSGIITSFLNCSLLNTTALTTSGTGSISVNNSLVFSGSAAAISIGSGTVVPVMGSNINSTNATAVITGAGTVKYSNLSFSGTGTIVNVTTQTASGTIQGSLTTAPSAGFLGERISSAVTSVATTSPTPKTITSIALTPGIWDIVAIASSFPTGGTGIMSAILVNISTTDNTVVGNTGDAVFQISTAAAGAVALTGVVPSFRATLSANATYYLVVENVYTSTTCPTNGRISATRVG